MNREDCLVWQVSDRSKDYCDTLSCDSCPHKLGKMNNQCSICGIIDVDHNSKCIKCGNMFCNSHFIFSRNLCFNCIEKEIRKCYYCKEEGSFRCEICGLLCCKFHFNHGYCCNCSKEALVKYNMEHYSKDASQKSFTNNFMKLKNKKEKKEFQEHLNKAMDTVLSWQKCKKDLLEIEDVCHRCGIIFADHKLDKCSECGHMYCRNHYDSISNLCCDCDKEDRTCYICGDVKGLLNERQNKCSKCGKFVCNNHYSGLLDLCKNCED